MQHNTSINFLMRPDINHSKIFETQVARRKPFDPPDRQTCFLYIRISISMALKSLVHASATDCLSVLVQIYGDKHWDSQVTAKLVTDTWYLVFHECPSLSARSGLRSFMHSHLSFSQAELSIDAFLLTKFPALTEWNNLREEPSSSLTHVFCCC